MCLSPNQHFVVSKDEQDTKEETGKYEECILHTPVMEKSISWAEARSNNEKNQAPLSSHTTLKSVRRIFH